MFEQYEDYDGYDDYMSDLYHEHIKEFKNELVIAYFSANAYIAKPAVEALANARRFKELASEHSDEVILTAGLIFSAVAIEVCMKDLFFRPFVHGSIHQDFAADFIVKIVMRNYKDASTKEKLSALLDQISGVDLKNYKRRPEFDETILAEFQSIQKKRNNVLHEGGKATLEDFDLSLAVSSAMIEDIFPQVVRKLGFHLHVDCRVCISNDKECLAIKYPEMFRAHQTGFPPSRE